MKRSEAIEIVKKILLSTNQTLIDKITFHEHHANLFALSDAREIIAKLEDLKIVDGSEFGSVCSRCKRKSWEPEC